MWICEEKPARGGQSLNREQRQNPLAFSRRFDSGKQWYAIPFCAFLAQNILEDPPKSLSDFAAALCQNSNIFERKCGFPQNMSATPSRFHFSLPQNSYFKGGN